jgi:repressor LexA
MTKNAQKLLDFLKSYINKNRIPPTYEEMKNFMELKSKSSIFQYLEYLEDLGHIKRDKLKSRSIKLNKMMPFFNEISAGNPLEILNEDVKYINYSDLFKNTKENSFACKVNGNSMEEFGIFNGDTVIVNRDITFSSKSIYAIQIDNTEVTLKKINILNSEIEIFGDSKNFHTKKYKKDRIKIIGKMISLIRSYK